LINWGNYKNIKVFFFTCSNLKRYHCVTHCGIYGEDYTPSLPIVLIQLSFVKNYEVFPTEMLENLEQVEEDNIEFYIMIHPFIEPQPCQHFLCSNTHEINLIFHCWAFKGITFNLELDIQKSVEMGIFEANGVKETHQNELEEQINGGIKIGKLKRRIVGIHSMSFSTLNAQLLLEDVTLYSFYSVAKESLNSIVAYHVIPGSQKLSSDIYKVSSSTNNLYDLLLSLSKLGLEMNKEVEKIVKIISTQKKSE